LEIDAVYRGVSESENRCICLIWCLICHFKLFMLAWPESSAMAALVPKIVARTVRANKLLYISHLL